METDLSRELLQLQMSRSGLKYVEMIDDYVRDIPERFSGSVVSPINRFNRNFSTMVKYRGRMLQNLERRFQKSWKTTLRKLRQL